MLNLFKKFKNKKNNSEIEYYYNNIVLLARNKRLYIQGGVPDTIDGRFELIILHCHLFVNRLILAGIEEKAFAQKLINYMFRDFDRSLREIGVGDLSVGKKIKFMVSSYYGRANTYQKALNKNSQITDEALKNNLYGTINPNQNEVEYMKIYIKNLIRYLSSLKNHDVLICFQNNINFFEGLSDE